jgi:hypothetical protein
VSALKSVFEIVAPISVITALMVYVGWTRNQAYFGYFGIGQGVLRPSVQDFALRSVGVTFGGFARVLFVALCLVGLDLALSLLGRSRKGKHAVTWIMVALSLVGMIFCLLGILVALGTMSVSVIPPLVGAFLLGVGAILLIRFVPIVAQRRRELTSMGLFAAATLYGILVLSLFWAATLYAQEIGQRAARGIDEDPSAVLSLVTVFSDTYLDMPGSQVKIDLFEFEGKSHYRYTGLSLLTYSNDRWFLITGRYGDQFQYRSSVVVLRDSSSIRVEVAAVP